MPLPLPTDSVWQLDTPLVAAPANPNNTSMWGFGSNTVFPGNDPDFEDVGYLLYLNEPTGTITPIDRVPGNTWAATTTDPARLSTQPTQPIFGSDNTQRTNSPADSFVRCTKPPDFVDTPTGIMTLEGWFRYANPADRIDPIYIGQVARFGSGSNTSNVQTGYEASPGRAYITARLDEGDFGGTRVFATHYVNLSDNTYAPFANAWNHLAMSYDGITLRLFLNGVLMASTPAAPRRLRFNLYEVGQASSPVDAIVKYLSNCRFTIGVARYTANFTPPTGPFPDYGPNGP